MKTIKKMRAIKEHTPDYRDKSRKILVAVKRDKDGNESKIAMTYNKNNTGLYDKCNKYMIEEAYGDDIPVLFKTLSEFEETREKEVGSLIDEWCPTETRIETLKIKLE